MINIGDGVLTLLGDSSQLDATLNKVNAEAPVKLKPVEAQVENLANAWRDTARQEVIAGERAVVAGAQMSEAAREAAFNMREAKAEIALAGEELGVKIPRHLRGFLAELPGVGSALNAAFTATAVIMLLQILAEATEKLSEWVAETYIYTEADKKAYEAQVKLNEALAEHNKHIIELKKNYDLIGTSGSERTRVEFDQLLHDTIEPLQKALNYAKDTVFLYERYNQGTREASEAAKLEIVGLQKALDDAWQQGSNLQKQYNIETLNETVQHSLAVVAAHQKMQEQVIAVDTAGHKLLLAQGKITFTEQLANERENAEKLYQLKVQSLRNEIAALSADPKRNLNTIVAKNAELRALESQHEAQSLTNYTTYLNAMKKAREQVVDTISAEIPNVVPMTPLMKSIAVLEDAFSSFGGRSSTMFYQMSMDAEKAFNDIKNSGRASQHDLLVGHMNLLAAQSAYARSVGKAEQADRLDEQWKKDAAALRVLTGELDRSGLRFNHFIDVIRRGEMSSRQTFRRIKDEAENTFDSMAEANAQAVASWILSEESLGIALRKGTAQVLAELAGRAAVYAMFYTAYGFAMLATMQYDKAAQAFTAAAEFAATAIIAGAAAYAINPRGERDNSGGYSNGEGPEAGSSAATPQQNPVQTTNVQRFAAGGLITSPTLAVLGDSKSGGRQTEAAIPLEDPQALAAIAGAIVQYMPRQRGGNTIIVEGLVSPDNLKKVIRQINNEVERNHVTLKASHARRVERKA